MVWVDNTVNRTENETGVSEIVGAIILMSVVAMAVGVVGVGLLSQPLPQKIPAISVDITAINNTINNIVYIRHEGGDSLPKSEINITLDGVDKTDSLKLLDGPASWSTWTTGETLYYVVPSGYSVPASVQIIYNSGSTSRSLGVYTPKMISTT